GPIRKSRPPSASMPAALIAAAIGVNIPGAFIFMLPPSLQTTPMQGGGLGSCPPDSQNGLQLHGRAVTQSSVRWTHCRETPADQVGSTRISSLAASGTDSHNARPAEASRRPVAR